MPFGGDIREGQAMSCPAPTPHPRVSGDHAKEPRLPLHQAVRRSLLPPQGGDVRGVQVESQSLTVASSSEATPTRVVSGTARPGGAGIAISAQQ